MECAGMVDVKTYECFPTLIHEVKMDIETYDKINMKMYVQRNYITDGSINDDLHTMSYFKPLSLKVLAYSEKILRHSGYEFDKLEITNMWGNLLNKDGDHSPHTHSNNILSGVYYVDVRETQGDLYVDNPNTVDYDWNRDVTIFEDISDNSIATNNWSFVPKEGDLYLFPSWAKHGVTPNTTKNNRISISFNLS